MKAIQRNILNVPNKEAAVKLMNHYNNERLEKQRKMNEQVDIKIFELIKTDFKYVYVQTLYARGQTNFSMKMTQRIFPTYEKTDISNSVCYDIEALRKEFESVGIDYKNIGYRRCLKLYKIAKSNKM